MKMANISLRDVASAAGVSVSTVSKVVSGTAVRARIHPATVTKVLGVVDELGYVPNHTARRLRAQGTGQLGLVLSGPYDPNRVMLYWLDGALLNGLSMAAREHHLSAVILYPQVGDELIHNTARYADGRIDGLLVRCLYHSEHRLLEVIDPKRLPLVALWSQSVPPGVGYADVDHYQGAVEAVEYLLSLGHRRIAYIDPEMGDGNLHFATRYRGYRDALRAAGIATHPERSVLDHPGVLTLLEGSRPITAAFVPQDTHAAGLIDWLHAQGVRIPEDLSVVGFDDFPNASLIAGGLTTVRQPIAEMTVQAVSNLLALIAGAPVEQCRSLVPARLITRHTTAPPAASPKRRPPGADRA